MFGRKHSEDTRQKMSDAHKGRAKPLGSGSLAQQIEVFDLKENTTTSYNSKSEAARALNIHHSVIDLYFIRNQVKAYKGRYIFKKI